MMPEFIEYLGERDIKNLLDSLEDKLNKGAHIFLDNCAVPWLIKHFKEAQNAKRLDYGFIKKANQFYKGLDTLFAKYGNCPPLNQTGNLYLVNAIAEEFRQSTGGTLGELEKARRNYENLTDNAKTFLGDAKETLDCLGNIIQSLYEYAKHVSRSNPITPIADSLTSYFCDVKAHFKEGISEASEKDVRLVARALEKAILTKDNVYIVTEDEHVDNVAECMYSLIFCEQTNLTRKLLDKILPVNIYVLKTNGGGMYNTSFSHHDFPVGRKYPLKSSLRIHYKIGTIKSATSIEDATYLIPDKLRKIMYSFQKYLPVTEQIPKPPAADIPQEPLTQQKTYFSNEKQIEEPIEEIITITTSNMQNAFEIIKDYARKAYESKEDTPEKEKGMSALEELLESADEELSIAITAEIAELERKDLGYKMEKVDAELEKIDTEIGELRHSEQKWYDNNEKYARYKMLNEQMDKAKEKKKELEDELSEI